MLFAYLPPIAPQKKTARDLILHTEEVTSGGDRRALAAVGRYVHRGDPRWMPPLPHARADALRPGNPLLRGRTAGFLGIAQNLGLGDETVGAIAAYAEDGEDEDGAIGRWGLFEAINVTALGERLFYEAETWLFENTPATTSLQGPTSLEPLTPAGLLIDGFDAWPAALLPYNPPYYPEIVEGEGYEPAREWGAWTLACPSGEGLKRTRRETIDWRAAVAACDSAGYADARAPGLRRWLAHLAGAETFPAHPRLRWALAQPFGRAVIARVDDGMCLGVPDFAPALRLTRGRLFPFGYALYRLTLARARRLRVFPAFAPGGWSAARLRDLYAKIAARAGEHGYRELVIAPIDDEDEKSAEALSGLGARVTQRFAVYEKPL